MSHRPTWTPAEGKSDVRHHSRSYSSRQLPSHTKLKFRQPGQGGIQSANPGSSEAKRRDLRAELEQRERKALAAKGGKEDLDADDDDDEDPCAKARRAGGSKAGQETAGSSRTLAITNIDADDDDEESPTPGPSTALATRPDPAAGQSADAGGLDDDESDDDDDDDDDDDEAALLRELEKIKRERAEEKERLEREQAVKEEDERENAIALGNPLLNLENALKGGKGTGSGAGGSGSGQMSFGVKRRWDDDVIFKNQAAGNANDGEERGFVNDLIRTEFHKRFLKRYLK
ncbi:hypothetical protein V8E36_008015 [Tilletia maclaganii]